MGDLSEFPLSYRLFLRAYRWRRIDPVPWQPLERPLAASRLALVSSAGLVAPGQEPFDETFKGGDPSFREIPADVDLTRLVHSHRSDLFDHAAVEADANLALPLERIHELAAAGRIGSVAPRHLSFMGSITAPGRLVKRTAPRAVATLLEDRVDVALLVPV